MVGLYIHIPFCKSKCYYCDFYSITNLNKITGFIKSLIDEIRLFNKIHNSSSVKVDSIFFGGGTPSIINPDFISEILEELKKFYFFSPEIEITIESNPGTLTLNNLRSFRKAGVNRLSIGVQSFKEEELKFLQRIHSASEAEESIIYAKESGFDNISMDLMFSFPGQTLKSLDYTLEKAISLDVNHISAYSLIYEPGTPLYNEFLSGKIKKLDDETDASYYEFLISKLKDEGFEHYEISNFSKNGKKCLHNLIYWRGEEYIGFGPSAHSFINGKRIKNFSNLRIYQETLNIDKLPVESIEEPNWNQRVTETLFCNLRAEGINFKKFINEFGVDILSLNKDLIKNLIDSDLAFIQNDTFKLTSKGYRICDEITLRFISTIPDIPTK